jgi:hypothetical protein
MMEYPAIWKFSFWLNVEKGIQMVSIYCQLTIWRVEDE